VTTAIGAQGFGPEIDGQFVVCSDARSFADAIIASLADPRPPEGRAAARGLFGQAGLNAQIALIEGIITRSRATASHG
jgi:hypothetical protein